MTLRFWDENVALYTTSDTFAVVVNATYKNFEQSILLSEFGGGVGMQEARSGHV